MNGFHKLVLCLAIGLVMTGSHFLLREAQSGEVKNESVKTSVVNKVSISAEEAYRIAHIAISEAKKANTDVAVVISDQAGLPLVMLRTDNATEQFVTGATRKAWTAVNFRASTKAVLKEIKADHEDDSQLPMAEKALFLYGGVPLLMNGTVVGGVGVAGFVEGDGDNRVAQLVADKFSGSK